MFFRYIFFATLAIFNCGVRCLNFTDLEKEIEDAISKADQRIMNSVVAAIADLNEASAQFNITAAKLSVVGLAKIQEDMDRAKSSIDNLVREANNVGIDVSSCTETVDEDQLNVIDELMNGMNECVGNKTSQAYATAVDTSQEVNNYRVLIVDGLTSDLEACGSGIEAEKCLGMLLLRVVNLSLNVPISIAARVSDVIALINYLKMEVIECGCRQKDESSRKINMIMVDVALCVNDYVPIIRKILFKQFLEYIAK